MDFTGNMFLQIQDTPVLEVQFISCKSHRDSLCVIRSKIYWRNSIFFFAIASVDGTKMWVIEEVILKE